MGDTNQMNTQQALDIVCRGATAWGESVEEFLEFPLKAEDSDEKVQAAVTDHVGLDEVRTVRDLWRALAEFQQTQSTKALELIVSCAKERAELGEGYYGPIGPDMSDEEIAAKVEAIDDEGADTEWALEIRDLWRALRTLGK